MNGNAIFRRFRIEGARGELRGQVAANNFLHRLPDPQRIEDLEIGESFQKKNASDKTISMAHFLNRFLAPLLCYFLKSTIIENAIMQPILIDGCQFAAQAAIEIVENSVVAPHDAGLLVRLI